MRQKKYICLIGIADEMRYLHKLGIFQCDLKSENILIDDDYCTHVYDFGFSRCFSESLSKSVKISMTCNVGCPLYNAPEQFDENIECSGSYGIDVYAFINNKIFKIFILNKYKTPNKTVYNFFVY